MFRRIWKWTKGDSLGAELIGGIANRLTGGLAGRDRNVMNVVTRILDDDTTNDNFI